MSNSTSRRTWFMDGLLECYTLFCVLPSFTSKYSNKEKSTLYSGIEYRPIGVMEYPEKYQNLAEYLNSEEWYDTYYRN